MSEFYQKQNHELIIYDIVSKKLKIQNGNELKDYH